MSVILFLCLAASFARAEVKQSTVVRVHAQTTISCPASAIMRDISDGGRLGRWVSVWNQPRNRGVHVTSVGSALDFVDEWNNRGRSVVTFSGSLSRNQSEIRFANEPTHGQYMCRTKVTLTSTAKGTLVEL